MSGRVHPVFDPMLTVIPQLYGPGFAGRELPAHDDDLAAAGDERRDRWYVDRLVIGDTTPNPEDVV